MLCLGAQPFGVVPKPPRPLDLTQMVPFGERGAATVTKRDVRVEREENVLMAAVVATLAEELPLQVSIVRVLDVEEDVRLASVNAEDRVQPSPTTRRLRRNGYFAK